MVALLFVLSIIFFVSIELFLARRSSVQQTVPHTTMALMEPTPPESVFLTEQHTWMRMTTDGGLQLGMDDLLSQLIGRIESVWTPEPGTKVREGDPIMRVSFSGRELTVPSPTSGVIERVNPQVQSAPWLLTHDAYKSGWVVALRPRDYAAAMRGNRIGTEARNWLSNELRRAIEFFSSTQHVAGAPVLADGAMPNRGALAMVDADRFEDFTRSFVKNG